MPEISLDASFAPELVEFWGLRYKEIKEELEIMKKSNVVKANQAGLAQDHAKLENLVHLLQNESAKRQAGDKVLQDAVASSRKDEAAMRDKLAMAEKEKSNLVVRLASIEAERSWLSQQMQVFFSQAVAFSEEADRYRRNAIAEMFPAVSFVDDAFQSNVLLFNHPPVITRALPAQIANTTRLYYVAQPPTSMPLRVPACGQPGYWFYPSWRFDEESQFELIVEGRTGEWSYLGCYVSAPFPGHEMKLSEWMTLDEQTKLSHCARVASQYLPPGQIASYPAQLDVKRRYEVGEWSVPCYTLRCVGFSMALHDALHAAATETASPASVPVPVLAPIPVAYGPGSTSSRAGSEASSTSGKRPRAGTSQWFGVMSEKVKKARPASMTSVHAPETTSSSKDRENDCKAE